MPFDPSTEEAEECGSLCVLDQPGLHSESQDRLDSPLTYTQNNQMESGHRLGDTHYENLEYDKTPDLFFLIILHLFVCEYMCPSISVEIGKYLQGLVLLHIVGPKH